ncbi:MAG: hypothetical protein AAGD25_10120 [Cyanobacteria bacterium P01_F01_bin.150]
MWQGLNIADWTALMMMVMTLIATIFNVLLWFSTQKTVQLLLKQVKHQIVSGYSEAKYSTVDAHRDLFFGIISNPPLLERFAEANDFDPKTWEIEKLSSFLVNQVLLVYLNQKTGITSARHMDGFTRDARNVFAYPTVKAYWEKARMVHSHDFRHFIETEVLQQDESSPSSS